MHTDGDRVRRDRCLSNPPPQTDLARSYRFAILYRNVGRRLGPRLLRAICRAKPTVNVRMQSTIWLPEPEHCVAGTARFPPGNIRYEQWHRNKITSRRDGAIPEINPKIVQEQLGHSSINLTLNTYSHVIKSMRGIAANALEDVVGSD
jgi:hypothetical protein